jgi:hypothetical protein
MFLNFIRADEFLAYIYLGAHGGCREDEEWTFIYCPLDDWECPV